MTLDREGVGSTEPLDRMGDFIRSAAPAMTAAQREQGLARLNARLAGAHRPRVARISLAVAGVAMVATGLFLWLAPPRLPQLQSPTPLTFRVENGAIVEGGYIQSQSDKGATVMFSEGTTLGFATGARGRLQSVTDRGARIALEQGRADVRVVHRDGAKWLVDAGPFRIQVRGTTFSVEWETREERLDLRMVEGKVSVTGPLSEGSLTVRGGQHLSIDLPKKAVLIEEQSIEPYPTAAPPSERPAVEPVKKPSHTAHVRSKARGPFHWGAALAEGNLDAIFRDVARMGLARSLASASSEDLAALADAARYRKQRKISRRALLTQRNRFPGSERAQDAAFLLGRLSEASEPDADRAVSWYDRYLSEAPAGAYASEALGRKMTSIQRRQGNAAAATVAEEYLRRFPQGTYAGAAAALRRSP